MIRVRLAVYSLMIAAVACPSVRAEEPSTLWGKPLDGWIAALRDRTGRDRRTAVIAVGYFGPAGKAAVPDLIDLVRQGPFKDEAVDALVWIGAGAEVTVPVLIGWFVQEGCDRLTAAGAIGFNPHVRDSLIRVGGPAVPALIAVLNGPNREMRVCAAEALGAIGPAARAAVPDLIRALTAGHDNSDPPVLRRHAIRALGQIGADARLVVPVLNDLLDKVRQNDDPIGFAQVLIRALDRLDAPPVEWLANRLLRDGDERAADELARLGPRARPAVARLRPALKDRRPQVRVAAAAVLARIGPPDREVIPVLIEALEHPLEEIDYEQVSSALCHLGPTAKAEIPALKRLLGKHQEVVMMRTIVDVLAHFDPEGGESVPALISSLREKDTDLVQAAIECLSLFGPRARDAAPVLAAVIRRKLAELEPSEFDGSAAMRCLRRIDPGGKIAIPVLIEALRISNAPEEPASEPDVGLGSYEAAETAALLLGSYGADARAAIPALIDTLRTRRKEDASWMARRAAALALGQIGGPAKAAIPVLREVFQEKPCSIWDGVLVALYQLDPDGKNLARKWVDRPPERSELVPGTYPRRAIVIGAMGRASLEADMLMRRYLADLDHNLTVAAEGYEDWESPIHVEEYFEVIGQLGVGARLAVPRLEELSKHRNAWVRLWAAETLKRVRPGRS